MATEIESRGRVLTDFQPKIEIVLGDDASSGFKSVEIRLVFSEDKVAHPGNWSGLGRTYEEALAGCILCLHYELEDRMVRMEKVKQKLLEVCKVKFPCNNDQSKTTTSET